MDMELRYKEEAESCQACVDPGSLLSSYLNSRPNTVHLCVCKFT